MVEPPTAGEREDLRCVSGCHGFFATARRADRRVRPGPIGPGRAEADGTHFFFGGFLAAASASAAFALASAALPASIAALR